jgi:alkylated DNA nucleotide flippase Atl1
VASATSAGSATSGAGTSGAATSAASDPRAEGTGAGAAATAVATDSATRSGPAARYAALAALVERGEWTTYGDIAVAAHGSARFARHVARAATAGRLPHAARVLAAGGRIASGWRDDAGGGPDACRDRLLDEGLTFVGGRADPQRAVLWEELLARADLAGVPRAPVIGG